MTELSALGIQTYELDVTDESAIHHLKDVLEDVLDGTLDILVNNAGTSYKNKPTVTVTEDEFQKTFDVNVKGVYLGCNAWVPQAIDRKEGGVIINIASVGATRPRPGLVWYNASKGAIWNVCYNSAPTVQVPINYPLGNERACC